ncbi:GNAT family N-acetyltransferase [Pedobacter yulinensis]|nr:GNAT family N-acetyltransferase [Pedobacter yulinensis]
MHIIPSELQDLQLIFDFYALAVAHQKRVFNRHWQDFDPDMVQAEIREQRQWKVLIDNRPAAVFATAFSDPLIWTEAEPVSAIYLHRIVTHPDFRGRNLVQSITDWAVAYARQKGLSFVRMDTWADNDKLLKHYTACGFRHAGTVTPKSKGLPPHYAGITLNLFEIDVREAAG